MLQPEESVITFPSIKSNCFAEGPCCMDSAYSGASPYILWNNRIKMPPPKQLNRIFQIFFSISSTTATYANKIYGFAPMLNADHK